MDWLVRSVLPRAELAVIYGKSGSGKSFFALDLCAAITRGVSWRDRRVAHGKAVYVCAEGASGFKARLRAYATGHGIQLHELPSVISDAPNFLDVEDAAQLNNAIVRWGKPDVIIIDTLSAVLAGGNENSGEDVGALIAHCKLLSNRSGALVVLIHHSGKDEAKGARGWSGLRAAADAEIEITRAGDYRTATITKMKDGSDNEQFIFKLKVIELDALNDEPQSSCIVEHVEANSEQPQAQAKTALKGLPKLVYDTLAIMAPSGTCNIEDLINGVKAKLPKEGEGRDLRRQKIFQALHRMIPDGRVCMHGVDRIGLTNIIMAPEGAWDDT